jgi:4-hydroxy-4-methyl-2-oxoglutarate aldolase
MIKDPPMLRVRRRFARPTKRLLAGFDGVPTGYLVDAMGGYGCLDYRRRS